MQSRVLTGDIHDFIVGYVVIQLHLKPKEDLGVPNLYECCNSIWNLDGLTVKKNLQKR